VPLQLQAVLPQMLKACHDHMALEHIVHLPEQAENQRPAVLKAGECQDFAVTRNSMIVGQV